MEEKDIEVHYHQQSSNNKEQTYNFTKNTVLAYGGLYIITCLSTIFCAYYMKKEIYINKQLGWFFWFSFAIVLLAQFYFQFNYMIRDPIQKLYMNYSFAAAFLLFIGPFGTGIWSKLNPHFPTTYLYFFQIFIVILSVSVQILFHKHINTQTNWLSVILIPLSIGLVAQLLHFYNTESLQNITITLYCAILLHMILNLQSKQETTDDEILVSACQIVGLPLYLLTYPVYLALSQYHGNILNDNEVEQKYLRKTIIVYSYSQFFPVFCFLINMSSLYNSLVGIDVVNYTQTEYLKPLFWISFSLFLISYPFIIYFKQRFNDLAKWLFYLTYVISFGFTLVGLTILWITWIWNNPDKGYFQIFFLAYIPNLIYSSILGTVVALLVYFAQDYKEIKFQPLIYYLFLNQAYIFIYYLIYYIQIGFSLNSLYILCWIAIYMIYACFIILEIKQQSKQEEEYQIGSMMLAQPIQTLLYRWMRRR